MRLRVHFQTDQLTVDEEVGGADAEAVVREMQSRAAKRAGFLVGAVIRRMSPLQFAQEVTRRYNASFKDNAPTPQSCEQFIETGMAKGFATPLEG